MDIFVYFNEKDILLELQRVLRYSETSGATLFFFFD